MNVLGTNEENLDQIFQKGLHWSFVVPIRDAGMKFCLHQGTLSLNLVDSLQGSWDILVDSHFLAFVD